MSASWPSLVTAWSEFLGPTRRPWYVVEHAVNALPEAERGPALAWLEAQIAASAEGPRRTTFASSWLALLERGAPDRRAELFDGIVVDNHHFGHGAVAQIVRRAAGLRELSLFECFVEGGVEALFPEGVAWTKLEFLSLRSTARLDGVIKRLAHARWTGALERLDLEDEAPLAGEELAGLLEPARVPRLRRLCLRPIQPSGAWMTWLSSTGLLEQLETLELHLMPTGDSQAWIRALAARAMPALRELTLVARGADISKGLLDALVDGRSRPRLARLDLRVRSAPRGSVDALRSRYPKLDADVDAYD
ncbi:hypothetical protein A7982_13938 [Minicystis rosea]|nr:hypothetical protein A7982_13938 [Minicystis rosea]